MGELDPVEILDYDGDIGSARLFTIASEEGLDVITADDNTLLLDIDSSADLTLFRAQFSRLGLVSLYGARCEVLRSRHQKWHVIVKLNKPVAAVERLLLQALLGSDRVREALSFLRLQANEPNPTCLLRPRSKEEDKNENQ